MKQRLLAIATRLSRKDRRVEADQALSYSFGEQDPMDVISYAGLEEQPNHLVIDGVYLRTLFISGYPLTASSGWLPTLIALSHNCDISCPVH